MFQSHATPPRARSLRRAADEPVDGAVPPVHEGGLTRRAALGGFVATSALLLAGCSADLAKTASRSSGTATAARARVASVSPAQASVAGQPVTITGTGLQHVKTVSFGDTAVEAKRVSADKIVATAPASTNYQPAVVSVSVLSGGGQVLATKPDALQYVATAGVGAQMQYALAHWQNYNTAQYGDLNPVGGDCANFVSQTLIARGWTMNDEWYNHDAAADWSSAWGYVPSFDEYLSDNAAALGLEKVSFDQADRSKVALGDIAIFYWGDDTSPDHTQVVDRIDVVDGAYKILMASHNDDYEYRDLDTTITTQHPGSTGHFWHLTR
ncbi:amidase domain-containing protein [Humibacter albus]|uniref:amidase domain-containing protein n=1 Tax=Humibacter albus TaxID=427754 RepID=UPI00041A5B1D|nr:amidase domain-containing protein [Humibacter albus]